MVYRWPTALCHRRLPIVRGKLVYLFVSSGYGESISTQAGDKGAYTRARSLGVDGIIRYLDHISNFTTAAPHIDAMVVPRLYMKILGNHSKGD